MDSANSLRLEQVGVGTLTGISLAVAGGEVVCLSGRTGIGKSRLLRAIADMEPHSGVVSLNGTTQQSMPAHVWRQRVTMIPAESQWWFEQVGDHFPEGDSSADLAALSLAQDVLDWPVSQLSSGEKQRLALLRTLVQTPRALLLDEPTANLDQETMVQVEQWLLHRCRQQHLPVLWVAHDQGQIQRVANRHFRVTDRALEQQS